jgi:hypothetical protein
MTVAIERVHGDASVQGSVLVADLRVSRPDNRIAAHQTALTPATVRAILTATLARGWDPDSNGSALTLTHGLIRDCC